MPTTLSVALRLWACALPEQSDETGLIGRADCSVHVRRWRLAMHGMSMTSSALSANGSFETMGLRRMVYDTWRNFKAKHGERSDD